MSQSPYLHSGLLQVLLRTDRAFSCQSSVHTVEDPQQASQLWVVEKVEPLATLPLQQSFARRGDEVVVCSFLRKSVAEIGPCRHFIGSTASVAAAAGFSVHCDHDLLRAARELRGRLAARSVSVLTDRRMTTVTANEDAMQVDVDRDYFCSAILTVLRATGASIAA